MIKFEAGLIHFLSDVFVAVIVVLKLPIGNRGNSRIGALINKNAFKGGAY